MSERTNRPAERPEPLLAEHRASDLPRETVLQRALPIYYALLLAILTGAGLYLLLQLRDVLLLLFISLLFAATTDKPARELARSRVPRAVAVVLIYLAALGIVIGIGWFLLPPLLGQLATLGDDLPNYVERYQRLRRTYESLRQEYPELGSFESQVGDLGSRIIPYAGAWLTALPSQLFGLVLDLLSVFVISMLLVTTRERLVAFTLSLVRPDHRDDWQRVMDKMWQRLGHYLRAKVIVMAIIAALTYGALLLLGIRYALLLAIVVGLGEAIPRIGPWLARIPLLAIAALEGWTTLGLVFAASVVIQNAKGYFISPFIEGDQLDIHPLLVFVAVLVGSALLGVAGAFVAVPAAAMLQVLFEEVIIPWRHARLARSPGEPGAGPGEVQPGS